MTAVQGVPHDVDPHVAAKVSIVPAKLMVVYDVMLSSEGHPSSRPKIAARVNEDTVMLDGSANIPKTLEAIDAIAALVAAVRAELIEQGVTE